VCEWSEEYMAHRDSSRAAENTFGPKITSFSDLGF
jgi:hypothetical protein